MSKTTSQSYRKFLPQPIGQRQRGIQTNIETIRRLQLESKLEGHSGCVNCLQWNHSGRLLASGSDDRNVIVWDPFKSPHKRHSIETGHDGNIFSVKFMPDFSDSSLATGASDASVKLIDIRTNAKLLDCKLCHHDRVKRLAVHPNEPHVIWSASEDGCILQYDTREHHCCSASNPKNILIDLKTAAFGCLAAKCIDINPVRDEMIAVGANDVHIRLFDRRYVRHDSWESCTAYFTPGHMIKRANSRSFGTTYLAFSPDGSELLANIHAEQVYLFNTYAPQEPYKSFNGTAKQLFLDLPSEPIVRRSSLKIRSQSHWDKLRKYCTPSELPDKYKTTFNNLEAKLQTKERLALEEFGIVNDMLSDCKNCSELYELRAAALVNRRWRGDLYQAIRDCCYALALKPANSKVLEILSLASHHSGDKESSRAIDRMLNHHHGLDTPDDTDSSMDDDDSAMEFYENIAIREISAILPEQFNQSSGLSSRALLPALLGVNPNDIHKMTNTFSELVKQETERASAAFDYTKRYLGHCNMNTDIKEANFFGDFIVAGSDDGAFYIWDKNSTNLMKAVYGDMQILNCLQPHPSICMLATSGIESSVKIWSPSGKICQDVQSMEQRCQENQNFIISDPLEAMIMRLYPPNQRDS